MVTEKKHLPNMLCLNQAYSFTLNPNDNHQFYDNYDKALHNRLGRVHTYVSRVLSRVSFQYKLYTEISTPFTNKKDGKSIRPRIHMHGFIMFTTYEQILAWYNEDFMTVDNIGYFDMDTLSSDDFYDKYARKNSKLMHKLLELAKVTNKIMVSVYSHKIDEYLASITEAVGNPQISTASTETQKISSSCSESAPREKTRKYKPAEHRTIVLTKKLSIKK